ncbi:DUF4142 domain-containing protein [Cupriavidus sp. NPDC089707]|uniref:DUF4142 domain-containing protein n=1 Tax=Cupriavidus sp. NPDC089707 TaxID=3363963 RepID=UPI0038302C77
MVKASQSRERFTVGGASGSRLPGVVQFALADARREIAATGLAPAVVPTILAAIALFRKAAGDAKDNGVKTFARQTLLTLNHHLEMAQQMASQATR